MTIVLAHYESLVSVAAAAGVTHMKETVKWNLCLSPLKVMKDWPGKLRVVISQ